MKLTVIGAILLSIFSSYGVSAQNQRSNSKDHEEVIAFSEIKVATDQWDCFIYPVPAIDELNVKVTKGQIDIRQILITDDSGNNVLSAEIDTDRKVKVDVSKLSNGKYYLMIFPDADMPAVLKRFYVSK